MTESQNNVKNYRYFSGGQWKDGAAKTGSLEPGKWADIIAVEKNPLDDVRVLQDVKFVMKAGVVYKGETK